MFFLIKLSSIVFSFYILCIFVISDSDSKKLKSKAVDEMVYFSLANYTSLNSEVISKQIIIPSSMEVGIMFTDLPLKAAFLVLQAHSYVYNISISNLEETKPLVGTNVGFVHTNSVLRVPLFYISNDHPVNVTVLVAAIVYSDNVPVPGGCNMEFPTKVAPYLRVVSSKSLITVENQPALFKKCTEPLYVTYEYFHFYQKEADFTQSSYFTAISSMISPNDIRLNGKLVAASPLTTSMRRFFSAYSGTGSVYVVLATLYGTNFSAAYIPGHTYACSMINFNNPCDFSMFWWTISAVILTVVGTLMILYGHFYFKMVLFIMGLGVSGLLIYLYWTREAVELDLDDSVEIWTIILAGCIFGLLWVFVWKHYGNPLLSLSLSAVSLATLIFGIILYSPYGDTTLLQSNINYVLIYVCLLCMSLILFSVAPRFMNILSCAAIGSYLIIFSLDYFFGTNLKYVSLNLMRRVTVDNFNMATIDPPYQNLDVLLTIVWGILTLVGIFSQWFMLSGKPTLPDPVTGYEEQSAPLISGPSAPNYESLYPQISHLA